MKLDSTFARTVSRAPKSRRRRRLARLASRVLSVTSLLIAGGARTEAGVLSDWIASKTNPDTLSAANVATNGDITADKTLFSQWMSKARTPFTSGLLGDSPTLLGQRAWEKTKANTDALSESELSAAIKLVNSGQLRDAERMLKVIAARETKKVTPYGEKAQYWLAETQFRLQQYVKAHDNFELLVKKYPGTDYVDKLVAREYQIAQIWLAHEDPKAKPLDWKSHFDGRAPLVDNNSFAIKALEHVRLHDPQGPLADDAALRMADHFHMAGDYELAATYYDQLINDPEHRKSEYRERALLSSIDSKMKAYIGPEYDVAGLEQAQDTITKTFNEYPDRRASAEGLYHTNDLIKDQYAERAYTVAMYYLKIGKAASAEYYFGMVIAKWPESKWAGESRKQMLTVAKMPRKASLPSKIMTMPGAPDPSTMGGNGGNNGGAGGAMGGLMNSMGGGGMGGMNGMGGGGMGPN
jgi:outer membrane protein assembly factor BamD (BamD/ComL family)